MDMASLSFSIDTGAIHIVIPKTHLAIPTKSLETLSIPDDNPQSVLIQQLQAERTQNKR